MNKIMVTENFNQNRFKAWKNRDSSKIKYLKAL